jgi:hypothetical protein
LITGASDSSFVADVSGGYQVEITDTNGCTATSAVVQVNVTGITDLNVDGVNIYPNAFDNAGFYVETGIGWVGAELEVFNYSGQKIYTNLISAQKQKIVLEAAPGIYFLHLRSKNSALVKKLIHL